MLHPQISEGNPQSAALQLAAPPTPPQSHLHPHSITSPFPPHLQSPFHPHPKPRPSSHSFPYSHPLLPNPSSKPTPFPFHPNPIPIAYPIPWLFPSPSYPIPIPTLIPVPTTTPSSFKPQSHSDPTPTPPAPYPVPRPPSDQSPRRSAGARGSARGGGGDPRPSLLSRPRSHSGLDPNARQRPQLLGNQSVAHWLRRCSSGAAHWSKRCCIISCQASRNTAVWRGAGKLKMKVTAERGGDGERRR